MGFLSIRNIKIVFVVILLICRCDLVNAQTGLDDRSNLRQSCMTDRALVALMACRSLQAVTARDTKVASRITQLQRAQGVSVEWANSTMPALTPAVKNVVTANVEPVRPIEQFVTNAREVIHFADLSPESSAFLIPWVALSLPALSIHFSDLSPESSAFLMPQSPPSRPVLTLASLRPVSDMPENIDSQAGTFQPERMRFETQLVIGMVIAFAFFVQSVMGFGSGLVAIPLMSLFMDVKDAVTLLLVFQGIGYLLCVRDCRYCRWDLALPLLAGMLVGVPLGTLALVNMPNDWVAPLLGGFILVFLMQSLFFPAQTVLACRTRTQFGFAGGFFGAVQAFTGAGGPVLCVAFASLGLSANTFRAMMVLLLLLCNVPRALMSAHADLIHSEILMMTVFCAPFFVVAVLVGNSIKHKVSDNRYRGAINVLLGVTALMLLAR